MAVKQYRTPLHDDWSKQLSRYICDTEGELPVAAVDGCTAYTADSNKSWVCEGNTWVEVGGVDQSSQAFPVGSVFIAVVSTNPATLLGYGTWSAFGAGRVMVGFDSGQTEFDTVEETGGAKTVASAGNNTGAAVADHAAHTHSVTSNVAVADHASHTHTYTDVPNHTHPHNIQGSTTAATTGTNVMASTATGGSARAMAIATANPTNGVATGTTAGPSATLSHAVTNNAVTSGNPSATLTHSVTQPTFTGSATSVLQPYIVCYFWKRTA